MCQQGDIVYVWSLDPQGRNPKERPFVIISDQEPVEDDDLLVGVAITGEFPDPLTDHYVKLPWENGRHPVTQLYKECAASCEWLKSFKMSEIINQRGKVPKGRLLEIIKRIPSPQ